MAYMGLIEHNYLLHVTAYWGMSSIIDIKGVKKLCSAIKTNFFKLN